MQSTSYKSERLVNVPLWQWTSKCSKHVNECENEHEILDRDSPQTKHLCPSIVCLWRGLWDTLLWASLDFLLSSRKSTSNNLRQNKLNGWLRTDFALSVCHKSGFVNTWGCIVFPKSKTNVPFPRCSAWTLVGQTPRFDPHSEQVYISRQDGFAVF